MRVAALIFPVLGVFADVAEVPIADFGGDLGGEVAGVEERGVADARLAGEQPPPHGVDLRPKGVTQPMPVTTMRRRMESLAGK